MAPTSGSQAEWRDDEAVRTLRALGSFDFCSDDELRAMVGHGELIDSEPGATLFREGEEADAFYVIVDGNYSVVKTLDDGRKLEVAVLEPGEVVGEMGVLRREHPVRSADVEAKTSGAVLRISRDHLLASLEESSAWAGKIVLHFAEVLSHRLRDLDKAYASLWQRTQTDTNRSELERFRASLSKKWNF